MNIFFSDLTYTQQTIAADVIPAAVGSIAAYVEQEIPELHGRTSIYKYPEDLIDALQSEVKPSIVFFSNYIWNHSLSIRFIAVIKDKFPDIITVMGGPNYPIDEPSRYEFLREYHFLDYYIRHEGEQSAVSLISHLLSGGTRSCLTPIPGVDFISLESQFVVGPDQAKIKDLSSLSSPYLDGRLDKFFDGRLLPIIQTNRGCPFTCTFCVEGTEFYSKIAFFPLGRVEDEIRYIGKKMKFIRDRGGRNDLFIADSNFGMYPRDLDICRVLQSVRNQYSWPEYINVATGKNAKERVLQASNIIDGALRLSGSVQSLTPEVLANIRRDNINAEQLAELGLNAGKTGANTYSEIIMCLPGETHESHLNTISQVIDSGFSNIYLFQLMILPGTPMSNPNSMDKYKMVLRHRVLPRCYGSYRLFETEINCAEIDSICVSTNTFSYDDYLDARLLHLVITVFYNDTLFSSILSLVKVLGFSQYDYVLSIYHSIKESLSDGEGDSRLLLTIFAKFLSDTDQELWSSKNELKIFCSQSSNIERFISGEIGNNLLFTYKSILVFDHLPLLSSLAKAAFLNLIGSRGTSEIVSAIDACLAFHLASASSLFDLSNTSRILSLSHDVVGFLANSELDSLLSSPHQDQIILDLTTTQKDLIQRMQSLYGTTSIGTARILSKVHLGRLFRKPVSQDETYCQRALVQGISE